MASTDLNAESSWREFQVALSAEASEALADYLEERLGQPPSVYLDRERGDSRVSAFVDVEVDVAALERSTRERLVWLETCGLDVGAPRFEVRTVSKQLCYLSLI